MRLGARAKAPSAIARRLSAVLRPPDQPGPSRAVAAAGGREAGRARTGALLAPRAWRRLAMVLMAAKATTPTEGSPEGKKEKNPSCHDRP